MELKICTVGDARNEILMLTAVSCSGQNTKKYVHFLLGGACCLWNEHGNHNEFLLAGHTKNSCDSSFEHVRCSAMKNEVLSPHEMQDVVQNQQEALRVFHLKK
eukprot:IDg7091t1